MKSVSLTLPALVAALLIQAAAAMAPMACPEMGGEANARLEGHGAHHMADVAGNAQTAQAADAGSTGGPAMSCCDFPSAASCSGNACTISGSAVIAVRMDVPPSLQPAIGVQPAERWLPVYGAPRFAIFRPPIA